MPSSIQRRVALPLTAAAAITLTAAAAGGQTSGGRWAAAVAGAPAVVQIAAATEPVPSPEPTAPPAAEPTDAATATAPAPDQAPGAPPAPAPAQPSPAAPPPPLAPRRGGVPVGKGMWIWLPERAEGGDPAAIVRRAQEVGLTHLYVRTGSSRQGFEASAFLEALLPLAHDAGLRVYGWDFPYLEDVAGDVERALTAIRFRTTTGHRIDGFVPDIETRSEGTNLSAATAVAYSQQLRAAVGAHYPLIACVPRPSAHTQSIFPYAEILASYDAVAPMVYWLNRQPDSDATQAVQWLAQFGKPVIPVGQAYDGGPEGGRPGPPPADEIQRFLSAAEAAGATGASFWSWQHATGEIWGAIQASPNLEVPADVPMSARQVAAVQTQLRSQGYWAPPTSVWDEDTVRALQVFQIDRGMAPSGVFDTPTRDALVGPAAPRVLR